MYSWESCKKNYKLKAVHISFIYYNIYVVLFSWLFPYKGPEINFFHQVSVLMIWCHYVAVLPPANRCIADRGFEYQYICTFRGTRERTVILDNLIQIFESNPQIRLKNQISQRSVIRIRRSGIFQIISDILSEVRRTSPCTLQLIYYKNNISVY